MKKKFTNKRIGICVILLILIVLKLYYNNNIALGIMAVITILGLFFDDLTYKPCYLFFLIPYMYVMKFSFNQISLFTIFVIIYIISAVILMIKNRKKIHIKPIIFLVFIIAIICIDGVLNNKYNIVSSMGWILNIVAVYLIIINITKKEDFIVYSNFFIAGILSSGILGVVSVYIENMHQYLNEMTRMNTVLVDNQVNYRFAGLNLDPNYFSVQVLVAFWCSVLIGKIKDKPRYIINIVLLIIGFLTISKMYLIALAITGVFYFFYSFKNRKKVKLRNVFLMCLVVIASSLVMWNYIYSVFYSRLSSVEDIDDLTTGRTLIWNENIDYLSGNIDAFLIGKGVGTNYLNDRATHCSYILIIYRIGVVGTIIFIGFILSLNKLLKDKFMIEKNNNIISIYLLPLLTIIITSVVLDNFDIDFFAYVLLLSLFAYNVRGGNKNENTEDI